MKIVLITLQDSFNCKILKAVFLSINIAHGRFLKARDAHGKFLGARDAEMENFTLKCIFQNVSTNNFWFKGDKGYQN